MTNTTCPIEVALNHTEPHPPVSHTVTLAGGEKMNVCADCANSFALSEVMATPEPEGPKPDFDPKAECPTCHKPGVALINGPPIHEWVCWCENGHVTVGQIGSRAKTVYDFGR